MSFFLIAIFILGIVGLIAAVVLYAVSKKFATKEDPRLAEINEILPGANCGGCGYPGCSGFATSCLKAAESGSLNGIYCQVGGDDVMNKIADILGMKAIASEPRIAVIRCNGTCENRPPIVKYNGRMTCADVHLCGAGESACGFGCLGCGDCAEACGFGGIVMNEATGLPEVNPDICIACGSCVNACPRGIIELRKRGPKDRRIWVDCVNKDKGPVAKKACTAACIGCGLCAKECKFEAITVENNVAYIDSEKCRLCRSCVKVCPTKAIHKINFPAQRLNIVQETVAVENQEMSKE